MGLLFNTYKNIVIETYPKIIRPILFQLSPDKAHNIGQWFLKRRKIHQYLIKNINYTDRILETEIANLKIKNPIGLGPALNKDGDITETLQNFGFGFTYIGSVLKNKNIGNKHPWFIRYKDNQSLGNSMGLPSKGYEYVLKKNSVINSLTPLITSLADNTIEKICFVMEKLDNFSNIFEIDISCPTSKEKNFEDREELKKLLGKLKEKTDKPLFVKLPHYDLKNKKEVEKLFDIVNICINSEIGITISNTKRIKEEKIPSGYVGLSGREIFSNTNNILKEIQTITNNKIPIIGTGGIFNGDDAYEIIKNGANVLAIVTAFIYYGPGITYKILEKLANRLKEEKFKSINELRGYNIK